jgi:hypothetical protein
MEEEANLLALEQALDAAESRLRESVKAWWAINTTQLAAADCGHPQPPPNSSEINGCPEIIVRQCASCAQALWWNVEQWRKL